MLSVIVKRCICCRLVSISFIFVMFSVT